MGVSEDVVLGDRSLETNRDPKGKDVPLFEDNAVPF